MSAAKCGGENSNSKSLRITSDLLCGREKRRPRAHHLWARENKGPEFSERELAAMRAMVPGVSSRNVWVREAARKSMFAELDPDVQDEYRLRARDAPADGISVDP